MKKGLLLFVLLFQAAGAYALTAAQLKAQLLALSNTDLYAKAMERKTLGGKGWSGVGACYVSDASSCGSCACSFYAQVNYSSNTGYNGLPYSDTIPGTGCMAWKGSTTPLCWGGSGSGGWGTFSPNICGPTLVDAGANQMRVALNSSEHGGDVCKLAEYVSLLKPPKAIRLSTIAEDKIIFLVNGQSATIGSPNFNAGSCKIKGKTIVGNADALFDMPDSSCKRIANLYYKKHGPSFVPPLANVTSAATQALVAIGAMTNAAVSQIAQNLTASANAQVQSAIDIKFNQLYPNGSITVSSSLSPAQVTAIRADIATLQGQIQPVSDAVIQSALTAQASGQTYTVSPISSTLASSIISSSSTQQAQSQQANNQVMQAQ